MKLDLKKYMSRKRLLIGGAIIGVIALIIVLNLSSDDDRDDDPSKNPPIAVQVEKIRRQQVQQADTASGNKRPVFET